MTAFPWDPDHPVGSPVLDDLHQGWFGLRPDAFFANPPWQPFPGQPLPPYSFYQGASVKIRKLPRTDPSTGQPETGHIRFWITKGDSGGTWQEHRIDSYNRTDPTFPALELSGWVYGPGATVPAPAPDVRYWVEGLTPGKCTLEFTCVRGSHTITHQQTFEVGCHWAPDEWREVVRQHIYLESNRARGGTGSGVDMDGLNISLGFMPNRDHARAIYEFHWTGLAKRAGASVYWGLSDSQWAIDARWILIGLPGRAYTIPTTLAVAEAFQQALLTGMDAVFKDLGWQFMAYHVGGIEAMRYLHASEYIRDEYIAAWNQMAEGTRVHDSSLINAASKRLAEEEQRVILAPAFAMIAAITSVPIPWILSKASVNPVPGGPSFFEFNPNGNITDYDDRWPWVENPFNGMLRLWNQQGILGRPPLVTPYIEEIAEGLSYGIGFSLPIK